MALGRGLLLVLVQELVQELVLVRVLVRPPLEAALVLVLLLVLLPVPFLVLDLLMLYEGADGLYRALLLYYQPLLQLLYSPPQLLQLPVYAAILLRLLTLHALHRSPPPFLSLLRRSLRNFHSLPQFTHSSRNLRRQLAQRGGIRALACRLDLPEPLLHRLPPSRGVNRRAGRCSDG